MTVPKALFRPKLTPIPPDVDIANLVNSTPNFRWAHREDARLHAAPYDKLTRIIHAVTLEQGLPLVVDNWHLRNDWNAALFSQEWLERKYGDQDVLLEDLAKSGKLTMPWSSFLSQIPTLSAQNFSELKAEGRDRGPRRVYGKDLDCPDEWDKALSEMLPEEVCYMGANDLMAKLPATARAANMMIYIGHEGTYTPAHRDQCATFGQNMMVHTAPSPQGVEGLAYWFIFSARDRHRVSDYWNTLGYNVDTEDFFASIEDLKAFSGMVYVVEQRVGDFVIIPPLATHQVYNHGGMTVKAAWNRTTVDTLELAIAETLPAYRFVCRNESYRNKAIVHQSLLDLSRFPPHTLLSSPASADLFMRLFRLYTTLLIDEFIPADYFHTLRPTMEKIPQQFNVLCSFCHTDIWNRFLTCRACIQLDADGDPDSYDICMECFARGRSCRDITGLEWVQQEKWSDLMLLWERCRGIYQFLGGEDIDDFNTETSIKLSRKTLASVCVEELFRRPSPRSNVPLPPEGLCHTCKVRHPTWKMVFCTKEGCHRAYCFGNLFRQFDEDPLDVLAKTEGYTCPVCRGICNCGACRKRKDQIGYEPKLKIGGTNAKYVADVRSVESLVSSGHTNTRWHLETKGTLAMKAETPNEREGSSTVYENGPLNGYEMSPPELPKSTFPDAPMVSFTGPGNLGPAILDPEMSTYFLGHHPSQDPAPYSEIEADEFLDPSMLVDNSGEQPWSSHYLDHSFDLFTAQPLLSTSAIDPKLFGSPILAAPNLPALFPSLTRVDQPSVGIAPMMLSKTPPLEAQPKFKTSSKPSEMTNEAKNTEVPRKEILTEIHVQRRPRPPKGPGHNSTSSPASAGECGSVNNQSRVKRGDHPPKSIAARPPPIPHPTFSHLSSPQPIPARATESILELATETPKPSPLESVQGNTKRRYEVNVTTGLDTIKRIKLIFHQDIQPAQPTSLPAPATTGTAENPINLDSRGNFPPLPRKRDILCRPHVPRELSPVAIADEVGRQPSMASESSSDDDEPQPVVEVKMRNVIAGVVVPYQRIDRSLYSAFMSSRARQTMVRRKRDGTLKGMKFEW